ncbi:MAG: WYL domain-containing protein [candidate division Zixibacteria bacterium]|nr:WYL domain-containing protein [candidate division Zixibacteria bacterium]
MDEPADIAPLPGSMSFVAFDTETTGLWAPAHRIVELGAVKFRLGEESHQSFQSLINPMRKIPADVINVHGITDEMVSDAPTAEDVLREFLDFCGSDAVLIAHNAPFDIAFVGCELDRAGLTPRNHPVLDTIDICHRFFPGLPSYSLLSLVKHLGIAAGQDHRALSDAYLVRQVFKRAAVEFPRIESRAQLLGLVTSHRLSDWRGEEVHLAPRFAPLEQAIARKRPVEIVYATQAQPPSTRVVRPQALFSLGSKIYMNAYCELARAERTFRLDRIVQFQLIDE